jgi:ABC-type lipoprotein export system ATPase subunit
MSGAEAIDPEGRTFLKAVGLKKRYKQGGDAAPVLCGVDLSLERGASLALLGVSGTGKTTLLNILGGIETPDAGDLIVDGTALGRDPQALSEHRRRVGFVFQFYNLLSSLTVIENVLTGLEASGPLPRDAHERAATALAAVDMAGRIDAFPAELSGGQQQRVAIARALVKRAPLVLADEPTGNLDPHTGERILDVLLEQCRALGSALIVVTHNPAVAGRTDRSATLVDGRILEQVAV